jgi:hypothetical protein
MSDKTIRNFVIILFVSLFIYLGYTRCIIGTQTQHTYDSYVEETPVHNTSTTFEVTYKDGTKNKVNATSVIYGQTNDNIYFFGNHKDTLYIIPKINVEEIKTLSK